jgi:hypothetical protein
MIADHAYPDVEKRLAERAELFRIAAVSALQRSRNGRDLDEHARAWAFWWAARPPLGVPLSEGVPSHD